MQPKVIDPSKLDQGFTMWYVTNESVVLCKCGGKPLPVVTDGNRDYATCDLCKTTWDITPDDRPPSNMGWD